MASLILLAGTSSAITVNCSRLGKTVPKYVGGRTDSDNGTERSTIRGQKKVIPVAVAPVDTATEAAIQAAAFNGAQIPCSGDILGNIQTLCSLDVASEMVPGLPGFFTMTLTIYEVNASTTLLRYAAGDTLSGETFTRSTIGTYTDLSASLQTAAINTKRDSHYIGGVRTLLLEESRTNDMLRASDFSNASWVKVNCTVTTGISDPSGGTTACTLTSTAGNGQATQSLVAGGSLVRTNSVWIKRRTGSGTVQILEADSLTWVTIAVTASWAKVSDIAPINTLRAGGIRLVTSADAVDVFGFQLENGPSPSSTIITTAASVTRGSDFYSLPFTQPPAEMSVYAKFIELGTINVTTGRVFEIASAAAAAPRFSAFRDTGGFYAARHENATTIVTSTLASTPPSLNSLVELLVRLYGDGSVDISQSVNGGAVTSSVQSAANALASAWSAQTLWLNSAGSAAFVGLTALQNFKVIAGARSLSEMRSA